VARILIIEDDATLQDAYSFILKSGGHKITSALNGKEGLALVKKATYDIVLLDLHMPVMDGWEFLKLYQPFRTPKTKVIVFSNMVEPDTNKQAEALGAYSSVLKSSMTPGAMLTLIQNTL
jgi:CheY-like chemotaxis protein